MNAYKIILRFYGRPTETKYIYAENQSDAFVKAHGFITPLMGCWSLEPYRMRKSEVPRIDEIIVDWAREAELYAENCGIRKWTLDGSNMEFFRRGKKVTVCLFTGEMTNAEFF